MEKFIRLTGGYCKGKYMKMSDQIHISDIKVLKKAAKAWINKSESFNYQDCFGSCTLVKFTITKVIVVKRYGFLAVLMGIACDHKIPDGYFPTPYQILREQAEKNSGFISPLGYTDAESWMLPGNKGIEVLLELNVH